MEVKEAIKKLGGQTAVARACGVRKQAVQRWFKDNRMPLSEWSGRTSYAGKMSALAESLGSPFNPQDICEGAHQYKISNSEKQKEAKVVCDG